MHLENISSSPQLFTGSCQEGRWTAAALGHCFVWNISWWHGQREGQAQYPFLRAWTGGSRVKWGDPDVGVRNIGWRVPGQVTSLFSVRSFGHLRDPASVGSLTVMRHKKWEVFGMMPTERQWLMFVDSPPPLYSLYVQIQVSAKDWSLAWRIWKINKLSSACSRIWDSVQVKDALRPEVSAALGCGGLSLKDEPSLSSALGQGGQKSHSSGALLHFLQWNLGGSSSISVIPRKRRSHFMCSLWFPTKRKPWWGHSLASATHPVHTSPTWTTCHLLQKYTHSSPSTWVRLPFPANPVSTLFLGGAPLLTPSLIRWVLLKFLVLPYDI